ncbi:MAG: hypothetical protein BTN85_0038 [Candidatus Methanohalarchaeum thermophilum]|uniref:Putative nickel insertion protein n=1 Tax=Methanohalarchaeum thermophilum TaxID=1903181 RepID=A0A1Q6DT67_METT1|nr:MAG: hypothetical protein BTN85_0038 [Candidatus Methanohalarchaeum thermophilum]
MDVAVFDPKTGAAGDMIISALIDAGASEEKVLESMNKATEKFGEVEIKSGKVSENSINVHSIDVISREEKHMSHKEIIDILDNSNLSKEIISLSKEVFSSINRAEENVHGETHGFHEVGQLDAIADVVGACKAYYNLDLDKKKVYCTPIDVGKGLIKISHGSFNVPAPAVQEILNSSKLQWFQNKIEGELLTPTGAAILSNFVDKSVSEIPLFISDRVGRGKGDRDLGDISNTLTVYLGEAELDLIEERVGLIEVVVDDVDGEVIGYSIDKLMEEGAHDVSVVPTTMKKGRTGNLIRVICGRDKIHSISKTLCNELGTLGVMISSVRHRLIAKREIKEIEIFNSEVKVKLGYFKDGELFDISAEYDDCKKIAQDSDVSLRKVKKLVEEKAREEFS